MPEFEELRLRVVLEDQASAQLAQIRQQLGEMGGGQSQQGFQRVQSNMGALNPVMRTMAQGTVSARNAMSIFGSALGPAGLAVAGLGAAFINQAQKLRRFTQDIIDIDTLAKVTGLRGGALDHVLQQTRKVGIENNKAIPFIEKVVSGIAELSEKGSNLNQFISKNVKEGATRDKLDEFFANMTGFAAKRDVHGMMETFIASAEYVYQSELKRTDNNEILARDLWETYLKGFGVDPETALLFPKSLEPPIEEQEKLFDASLAAAEAYRVEYDGLAEQYKTFNTARKEAMLPAFTEINKMFGEHGINAERWGKTFGTIIAKELRDVMGIVQAVMSIMEWVGRMDQKIDRLVGKIDPYLEYEAPIVTRAKEITGFRIPQIQPEEPGGKIELKRLGTGQGSEAAKQSWLTRFGDWSAERFGAGNRQGGGAVAGGQPYTVGEAGPELFVPQGGGTILPGFGGAGNGLSREQIDEMRDNTEMVTQTTASLRDLTEEFRQLANFLQPMGEQPEARQYGGSAYRGRKYLVGERGPEIFMPSRQGGGRVNANQPYLVGEKGPELMVPQQGGVIQSGKTYRKDVEAAITAAATETGLNRETIKTMVEIESSGDPRRINKTKSGKLSQYRGLLQINETTFKKYGGKGNILDPKQNVLAGARRLAEYKTDLRKELDREPEDWEIYMRHQQGVGGFRAHYRGAQMGRPAWESFFSTKEGREHPDGPDYSKAAIWGNLPPSEKEKWGSVENVTSEAFLEFWKKRYGSKYAVAHGQEYVVNIPASAANSADDQSTLAKIARADNEATDEADAAAASAELDRSAVDKAMGAEITTVKGQGVVDVDVSESDTKAKYSSRKRLLKDIRLERATQMQPAEAGSSGMDTTEEAA